MSKSGGLYLDELSKAHALNEKLLELNERLLESLKMIADKCYEVSIRNFDMDSIPSEVWEMQKEEVWEMQKEIQKAAVKARATIEEAESEL